jgi:hypothetical protein
MRTRYPRPAAIARSAFAGFCFPPDVIVLAVRWYLRFALSYRDIEELLAERGIDVDHVTVYRWVHRLERLRRPRRAWASGQTAVSIPSYFPPPDARPRGTGRTGRGRQVTAEVVERPFAHVRSDGQYQVGMGGDSQEDGSATCKIAGIAYTGSNPVPATTALTSNNAVVGREIKSGSRVDFPSSFPPPDAPPTPPAYPALLGRTRPRSPRPAGARSGGAGGCRPAGRGRRHRHGAAGRR